MAYQPTREDRAEILRLAEQGKSARSIARLVGWSRPTISKVLAQEGFDPRRKLPPPGAEKSEPSFDFEAEMARADAEAKAQWEKWTKGEDLPTYGIPEELRPS